MNCCTDILPMETSGPMEDGLRILARIIARDIMSKRLARAQMEGSQKNADHDTTPSC